MKVKRLTVLLVLAGMLAFTNNSNAQETITFSPGISLPSGDFADMAGAGFGVSAGYMKKLNDKMNVGGEIGYYSFGSKKQNLPGFEVKWTSSLIPIMAKYQYVFLQNDYTPYAEAQIGYTIVLIDSKVTGAVGKITAPSNQLALGVAVGASRRINENVTLGMSAGYRLTSDIPTINIDFDLSFDMQYLKRLVF